MSPESVCSGTASGEDGGSTGVVDFGVLDVTFSASFYTGVFLSSRELQGNYREHQEMVIRGMKDSLLWGWTFPRLGSKSCDRRVSPVYFIGSEPNNKMSALSQEIMNLKSCFKDVFEFESVAAQVKFFEFGFASVSVRFEGLRSSKGSVCSDKEFRDFLSNCKQALMPAMDSVVAKATNAYRCSVPCCIKNSDIWNINNFGGLEGTEGMYRVGEVQETSVLVALEQENKEDFNAVKAELKKSFFSISKDMQGVPYRATYKLFTSGESITIALGRQKNDKEINEVSGVIGMLEVQLVVGKYFNNFFCSYFNYASCEYEAIASRSMYRFVNIKRLRNLMEKFLDCKTLYSQVHQQILGETALETNIYKAKLLNLLPQNSAVQKFWNNSNQSVKAIMDMHNQISTVRSSHSLLANLDMAHAATYISLLGVIALIAFELFDGDFSILQGVVAVAFSAFTIMMLVVLPIFTFGGPMKRKLYYICGLQKEDLKNEYEKQEKRNESKKSCICKVAECHRCQGSVWHPRVFYRMENLCHRCGIEEGRHDA